MSDNTVPAWAIALVETMNAGFAEVNARFDQVAHHLERLELATDRAIAAIGELEAQLTAAEKRLGPSGKIGL